MPTLFILNIFRHFISCRLDARLTGDQEIADSNPAGWQHSFMEIDREIFSMVIFSLLLIQEGQLSVSV